MWKREGTAVRSNNAQMSDSFGNRDATAFDRSFKSQNLRRLVYISDHSTTAATSDGEKV